MFYVAVVSGNATATTSQPTDKQPQYTLTAEQRQQVEASWTRSLVSHADKLALAFERSKPSDIDGFYDFTANSGWYQKFIKDWDKAKDGFKLMAERNAEEYEKIRDLHYAFVVLHQVKIEMGYYLEYGGKENLQEVRDAMTKFLTLVKD